MRLRVILLCMGLAACGSGLGADAPRCPEGMDLGAVQVSSVAAAQSVPTAEYGPCIKQIKPGWKVGPLLPSKGMASLSIDSDRLGLGFLTIALVEACDAKGLPADSGHKDIDLRVSVSAGFDPVPITLIPVAARHGPYAAQVAVDLSDENVGGRPLHLSMDDRPTSVSDRIQTALSAGEFVLVLDDHDAERNEVELRLPGEDHAERGLDLEDAIEEIEEELGDLEYRGTWYHEFAGGCIIYELDAEGPDIATLHEDINSVLGFYPLAELRREAEKQGYNITD